MVQPKPNRLALCGCLAVLSFAGCTANDSDGKAIVTTFEQNFHLEVEGANVSIPLDALDVWLSKRNTRPESFMFHGDGIALVGKFDPQIRVGYEENWQVLLGQRIELSNRGGNPRYDRPSILTVPGVGQFRVIGGSFTVDKVEPGHDGQTPLRGRIEIEIRAATGKKTLSGTFSVLAMTWG